MCWPWSAHTDPQTPDLSLLFRLSLNLSPFFILQRLSSPLPPPLLFPSPRPPVLIFQRGVRAVEDGEARPSQKTFHYLFSRHLPHWKQRWRAAEKKAKETKSTGKRNNSYPGPSLTHKGRVTYFWAFACDTRRDSLNDCVVEGCGFMHLGMLQPVSLMLAGVSAPRWEWTAPHKAPTAVLLI